MKSDAQIKLDVQRELTWEPSIDDRTVDVLVKDGIVSLLGHVDSYSAKLTAEKAAQRIAGVKALATRLEVVLPSERKYPDMDIAKAAEHVLRWNNLLPGEQVKVLVEHGFVTLSGAVDWQYQRWAAERAIRNLSGVKGVIDNIALAQKPIPTDIKTKIEDALERVARNDADRISVLVDGGTVTLSGKVHSFAETRAARTAAWAARGVTKVIDNMQVAE
jgi:osmotically-inducible protein OsmY